MLEGKRGCGACKGGSMLDTSWLLTLQLALAYGIGILVLALSMIAGPARFGAVIADFERSPGLTFLGAVLALAMGLAAVFTHNLWTDPIAGLVSLIGWVVLAKGALVLAAPEGLMKLAAAITSTPGRVRTWGIVLLVLAAVFLAPGIAGHALMS